MERDGERERENMDKRLIQRKRGEVTNRGSKGRENQSGTKQDGKSERERERK